MLLALPVRWLPSYTKQMHESIFSGFYSHCYAIFDRQNYFKRKIRISFNEYAKPDFVSRTEIRFSINIPKCIMTTQAERCSWRICQHHKALLTRCKIARHKIYW